MMVAVTIAVTRPSAISVAIGVGLKFIIAAHDVQAITDIIASGRDVIHVLHRCSRYTGLARADSNWAFHPIDLGGVFVASDLDGLIGAPGVRAPLISFDSGRRLGLNRAPGPIGTGAFGTLRTIIG
jgi:hypothetical protein